MSSPPRVRRTRALFGLALAAVLAMSGQSAAAAPPPSHDTSVNGAFARAATAYDVPRDLLVAVGYAETRLDAHRGLPSQDDGYGVMHSEVPGNDHTDPGPHWDWASYMSLVRGDGDSGTMSFTTWGSDVSVRQQPTTGSTRVATLPGPTTVRVKCQVHGQLVNYQDYSNDAGSYLPDYGGYISNIFIDVDDAWLPGVSTC
ncbi:hypothetical protein [Streptomyces sp. 142MFCol3.1]|uniref:hypothetical protein n=1 Tax=Streptomyces sp. 142MFCol3.1 TaxID=1172179 RepID=UPI00040732AF|nr:hypothetical protein [Streptomyces sp. 142MFCol3.1]